MTAIAQKLDRKLKQWQPEKARAVEKRVAEIIELADEDSLELRGEEPLAERVGHTRGRLALRAPAGNWCKELHKRNWRS
jgi:hypothetical protein